MGVFPPNVMGKAVIQVGITDMVAPGTWLYPTASAFRTGRFREFRPLLELPLRPLSESDEGVKDPTFVTGRNHQSLRSLHL
jgi:hypothetical protein